MTSLVRDVMTSEVVTIAPWTPFRDRHPTPRPVDSEGNVLGVVTEADLLLAARSSPTMSAETSGSSETPRMPWYRALVASSRKMSLTSSTVVGRLATNTMSATEPTGMDVELEVGVLLLEGPRPGADPGRGRHAGQGDGLYDNEWGFTGQMIREARSILGATSTRD